MLVFSAKIYVQSRKAQTSIKPVQSFFASLEALSYLRSKDKSNPERRKNQLDAADFKAHWKVENRDCFLQLYNAVECGSIMRRNLGANLTTMFKKQQESL